MCIIVGQPKLAWTPAVSDRQQFVQADFGIPVMLYGVMTKGHPVQSKWVTKYKVQFRYDDGVAWQWVDNGQVRD